LGSGSCKYEFKKVKFTVSGKKSKNYGSTKKPEGKRSSQQNNNENLPLLSEQENDYYSAEDTIVTLHDITLSLPEGSLLGICGGVGSGKTSIIQAILGMVCYFKPHSANLFVYCCCSDCY